MAIKFVDREPEPGKSSKAPTVEAEPDAEALAKSVEPELAHPKPEPPAEAVQPDPPGGMPQGQLPFAKSEPKPRGRKKPLR